MSNDPQQTRIATEDQNEYEQQHQQLFNIFQMNTSGKITIEFDTILFKFE